MANGGRMGYLKIPNLYKSQSILRVKECFAMEKVHGTSASVGLDKDGKLRLHSGGESHERFAGLFDQAKLEADLKAVCPDAPITVYGEAYGGKQQGMSHTYGPDLKFIAFDVKIGDTWLDVVNAHDVATKLGIEFVHYVKITTDLADIDRERDADSVQAVRNGVGPGKMREGVVLRPIEELVDSRGNRVMCKHKRAEFGETKTPRVVDISKLVVEANANKVAEEWVTEMRLDHVLDKCPCTDIKETGKLIAAMWEDVQREAEGEIEVNNTVKAKCAARTAWLWKRRLAQAIGAEHE